MTRIVTDSLRFNNPYKLISSASSIGKLLVNEYFSNGVLFTKQLGDIPPMFIMVNLIDGDKTFSKKIITVE